MDEPKPFTQAARVHCLHLINNRRSASLFRPASHPATTRRRAVLVRPAHRRYAEPPTPTADKVLYVRCFTYYASGSPPPAVPPLAPRLHPSRKDMTPRAGQLEGREGNRQPMCSRGSRIRLRHPRSPLRFCAYHLAISSLTPILSPNARPCLGPSASPSLMITAKPFLPRAQ